MLAARDVRRVRVVLTAAAVLDVIYWTTWYAARPLVASNTRSAYYEFENAFPLADTWLLACCVAATVALLRRSPSALLWLLLGAGAGFYLLGMDVLYDAEHGIWWRSGAGGWVELLVNVLTAAGSWWLASWSWRHRDALLSSRRPGTAG